MGTEEGLTYSLEAGTRQVDRRAPNHRSRPYYGQVADLRGFYAPQEPYYNVVAFPSALNRCAATEILHLQVRRVCMQCSCSCDGHVEAVRLSITPEIRAPARHFIADPAFEKQRDDSLDSEIRKQMASTFDDQLQQRSRFQGINANP